MSSTPNKFRSRDRFLIGAWLSATSEKSLFQVKTASLILSSLSAKSQGTSFRSFKKSSRLYFYFTPFNVLYGFVLHIFLLVKGCRLTTESLCFFNFKLENVLTFYQFLYLVATLQFLKVQWREGKLLQKISEPLGWRLKDQSAHPIIECNLWNGEICGVLGCYNPDYPWEIHKKAELKIKIVTMV